MCDITTLFQSSIRRKNVKLAIRQHVSRIYCCTLKFIMWEEDGGGDVCDNGVFFQVDEYRGECLPAHIGYPIVLKFYNVVWCKCIFCEF